MKNRDELLELLDALSNETLSETQHARLSEILISDSRARQRYYEHLEMHLKLSQWAATDSHARPLMLLKEELDRRFPLAGAHQRHRSMPMWMGIGIAVAAVVLTAVSIQFLPVGSSIATTDMASAADANDLVDEESTYIATLARSADCVWEPGHRPKFDGQRLLSQELQLANGVAEFRLETGVVLVMEGPAAMTISSSSHAILSHGRVVLHGNEMAKEFGLHTPHAVLFDEGTEYGAFVDPAGDTEVHVFDGRVRIESLDAGANDDHGIVSSGNANRINAAGSQPVPLSDEMFVRKIPASNLPRIPSAEDLLAVEDFEYDGPVLGNANGGQGWAEPWRLGVSEWSPASAKVVPDQSLSSAALGQEGEGGYFLQDGRGRALRPLATPLRMDTDAVYYLSFFLKKSRASPRGVTQYGSLSLRTSDRESFADTKLLFGMSSENDIIMNHNDHQILCAPQLLTGETYFYVAKIIAGQSEPDQVMLRVYSPLERVTVSEPVSWNSVSRPQYDDTVYSNLFIYVGGDAAFEVDRIRIGSTWDSVAQ